MRRNKTPDELSIEELLQTAKALVSKKPMQEEDLFTKITWTYSKSTYECLQCSRIYHGELFHSSVQEPKKRYVSWCPKCLDEKLWWLHQNFTIVSVEEPK